MRVRLTLLYGALFLCFGAALVAVTYGLFEHATEYTPPRLPPVPRAPAIKNVTPGAALGYALPTLAHIQGQLAHDQQQLIASVPRGSPLPKLPAMPLLARDQHQLTQDQRELARAVRKLTQAEQQLSRSGAVEAAQRAADSHQLVVDSGIALGVVALLALVAGWFVAGRMLQPIRTITRTARRISSNSLDERLAMEGPQDELKELGDTLDELFGRLDAAFEAQRRFVASASHELRTPLARQRTLIQVAIADPEASFSSLRAAHERVLASEEHLEQLIDALLALTRGQAGIDRHEVVDLASIASNTLLMREANAASLNLDIRTALASAPTAGDPRLVERLVANLIDNAIRHNLPGGWAEIITGTEGQRAFLKITNSGPAVPPDQIERIFQPFQRLDGGRIHHHNGHGLGLSIVHAIAGAHHADVTARPATAGGLTVAVFFPQGVRDDAELGVATAESKRAGPGSHRLLP